MLKAMTSAVGLLPMLQFYPIFFRGNDPTVFQSKPGQGKTRV